MHELSLAQAIADATLRYADGRPVVDVRVRIGHFRQVVPDALQFAWELLTADSELEGTMLIVEHVPAVVRCGVCDRGRPSSCRSSRAAPAAPPRWYWSPATSS